ncbi:MAG: hypothetical protein OEX07_13925, partial [Gammaproteobacteria bacterium]|nr:hypothetical protein [Gammaproteobacteria bacterium]
MRKLLSIFLLAGASSLAMADSITPTSYSDSLAVGESATITKTVTINQEIGGAVADVLFLFDTTGSMSPTIDTAKTQATAIMTGLAALGDFNFGVGRYDDFPTSPYGSPGDSPWTLEQNLTATIGSAQTAIDGLVAVGGNDDPESQLTALTAATTDVSWREHSAKFIIWFGDQPGHEGTEAGYPGTATTASTIAALAAVGDTGIIVNAINSGDLDATGQATTITTASGGGLFTDTTDPADFVTLISDSITDVYQEYSEVCLNPHDNLPGVEVTSSPCYSGPFDRSVDRTFTFDVTFT